jgi:hypothetical protein
MQLPNNSEAFKSIVIEKLKTYCDTNIWPFDYEKFTAWLNNFDCKKEEYVALQVLDNLIVRSNEMAKVSYSRLLNCDIRQHLISHSFINDISISEWRNQLLNGSLSDFLRFSPVKKIDDEGESGGVIYRLMSEELDTNRYSYAKAKSTPKVLILIDDFIGSGTQFSDFAKEFGLEAKLKYMHILYCPLIGFDTGIQEIKKSFPSLHIIPSEKIFIQDGLFYGDENDFFKNDQQNTIGEIKTFWKGMHKKYAPGMPFWFGFGQVAFPLAFEWGCPNQTPSILYLKHSVKVPNWNKLFSRRS